MGACLLDPEPCPKPRLGLQLVELQPLPPPVTLLLFVNSRGKHAIRMVVMDGEKSIITLQVSLVYSWKLTCSTY